jgi:hypothetical protein
MLSLVADLPLPLLLLLLLLLLPTSLLSTTAGSGAAFPVEVDAAACAVDRTDATCHGLAAIGHSCARVSRTRG